ncbi:hypothetical protein JOF58_004921 [Streptomyces cinnamonensis]|nr:hypothetical protein [Streptomyces virginiae]
MPVRTGTGPYFRAAPSWIQLSCRVRSTQAIRPRFTGQSPALFGVLPAARWASIVLITCQVSGPA